MRRGILIVSLWLFVGACAADVNHARPGVAGEEGRWIAQTSEGVVDAVWWKVLGDPALDALVAGALAHNTDLREAGARLREARANRAAAAGKALPELDAKGSVTETGLSRNGQLPLSRIPAFDRNFPLFDLGFDASWEIDLWGGTRQALNAADARSAAASARLADTRLQVIAETVRSYGDLRGAQAKLAKAKADFEVRLEIDRLTRLRVRAGETTLSDSSGSAQRADAARAAITPLEADTRAAMYRLALLAGKPPEALLAILSPNAPIPVPPASVAAGLRSELLERRPDIRAADAELAAARGDVGVLRASLFPRLSLIGGIGQQARSADDLVSLGSTTFSIGPSFSWPVFSAGRIRAQIGAANARADAAAIHYERVVLGALQDSETALNRYAAALSVGAAREAALHEAQLQARLVEKRWKAGEDNRIQSLEAESAALAVEQQLIAARADALSTYVAASKALGGGW
jgi:NodT family efflux transporter outer membrane factor (OMF) lipoprotein